MNITQLFEKVSERLTPSFVDYFNPMIKKAKKKSILHGAVLATGIGITLLLPKDLMQVMIIFFMVYPAMAFKQICSYWELKQLDSCIKQGQLPELVKNMHSEEISVNIRSILKNIPLSVKELTSDEIQDFFKMNLNIDDMKILSDAIKANGTISYSELSEIYSNQSVTTKFIADDKSKDKLSSFAQQHITQSDKSMQTLLELNGCAHNQRFDSKSVL